MQIYLVGGAVRDQLLHLPVKERDWVVVGATPAEMLALNYKPVGKDFPVFLHPQTHEEYALARTERKTGPGYTGFAFYTAQDVSLEEDLQRRDLTINAMAQTADGKIIDPYDGQQDLQKNLLRHVSPAFSEDPVRILRIARFAARFPQFNVHTTTNQLMQLMVKNGEVNALVAERVWQEFVKALTEKHPERFFAVLADCNALPILFPEFTDYDYTALKRASVDDYPLVVRFSALCYPLAEKTIHALVQRYRIPREYYELALLVAHYYPSLQSISSLPANKIVELLTHTDAFRRPQRFAYFLQTCAIINNDNKNIQFLQTAYEAAKGIDIKTIIKKDMSGIEIADALREKKIEVILKIIHSSMTLL